MTFSSVVMSALTFNREGLKRAANNDDDTVPALLLIFINAAISGAIAMNKGTSTSPLAGILGTDLSGVELLISDFVVQLLFSLIFGFFISVVIKMFGGKSGTMSVVRMVGATTIWTILGVLLSYIIPILSILSFVGFIALLFGISAYSGKNMLVVFIAMIIAAILMIIVMYVLVLFLLIGLLAILF